jgi:hypothetical protein
MSMLRFSATVDLTRRPMAAAEPAASCERPMDFEPVTSGVRLALDHLAELHYQHTTTIAMLAKRRRVRG